MDTLTISGETHRRFILGQQGLWPGRRWRGKDGVIAASQAGAMIQVDPINVVARSHDIALYGRVLDYQPEMLEEAAYTDRVLFDWGGTVLFLPMAELPYWRVVMARKQQEPRWAGFARDYADVIAEVRAAVQERGPLSTRDFATTDRKGARFRSGKVTSQALYYLWLGGELMTHGRRNFDRLHDLTERIVPPEYQSAVSAEETDDHFMLAPFRNRGMVTARQWRQSYAGMIERAVSPQEASVRLDGLLKSGTVAPVALENDSKQPHYVLAGDLPLLTTVQAGDLPEAWKPLESTTEDEMVFLAPLEIVSARGRAKALFDFDFLWEVYKPAGKRRWGYYVLPILWGDRLVARLDLRLERESQTLFVKSFWIEDGEQADDRFVAALAKGMRRFIRFVGAGQVDALPVEPKKLRRALEASPRQG